MHCHVEFWIPGEPGQLEARQIAEDMLDQVCGDFNDAHFDYGTVGGRWTGEHDGYKPYKDPANTRPCKHCGTTGVRTDTWRWAAGEGEKKSKQRGARIVGYRRGKVVMQGGIRCNACHGTGKEVLGTYNPHNGDVMPQSRIYRKLEAQHLIYVPKRCRKARVHGDGIKVLETLKELGLTGGTLVTGDCHY